MAVTQAQLDALEEAIYSGELTVRDEHRTVTYRSISEMLQVRDMLREQLGVAGAGGSRTMRIAHSKDLDGGECESW